MKYSLLLITIMFSVSVSSQSLYSWPTSGPTLNYEDEMTIIATRSLYGITIDRKFDSLPSELKDKIINYLKNTKRSEFQGMGTIHLPVVKRSGAYYVPNKNASLYGRYDPL